MLWRFYNTLNTMYTRVDPDRRAVPVLLGVVTLVCVAVLLTCDVFRRFFLPTCTASSRLRRSP